MQGQPVPGPRCQGRWLRADAASRLELRKTIGGRRQPARETAQIAIDQREAALLGAVPPPHPKPSDWKLQLHCLPGTLQIDRPRVAQFLVSIEKWGWLSRSLSRTPRSSKTDCRKFFSAKTNSVVYSSLHELVLRESRPRSKHRKRRGQDAIGVIQLERYLSAVENAPNPGFPRYA